MENKAIKPDYIDFIEQKKKRRKDCSTIKSISTDIINRENQKSVEKIDLLQQIKELVNTLEEQEIIEQNNNRIVLNDKVLNHKDMDILECGSEYIEKIKEEEKMKRICLSKAKDRQVKFLLISFFLIVVALINLLTFTAGSIYINPYISIFLLIMGTGWGATAIAAIFEK